MTPDDAPPAGGNRALRVLRYFLTPQFLLFLFAGGTAALANWLSRRWLGEVTSFGLAVVLAYGIGIGTAFLLNRWLVFPRSPRPIALQFRDFILVNLASFPVVWGGSLLLAHHLLPALGIRDHLEDIAHGIGVMLPVAIAFLLHKFFTFRVGTHAGEGAR